MVQDVEQNRIQRNQDIKIVKRQKDNSKISAYYAIF